MLILTNGVIFQNDTISTRKKIIYGYVMIVVLAIIIAIAVSRAVYIAYQKLLSRTAPDLQTLASESTTTHIPLVRLASMRSTTSLIAQPSMKWEHNFTAVPTQPAQNQKLPPYAPIRVAGGPPVRSSSERLLQRLQSDRKSPRSPSTTVSTIEE
jgi:hypothetical protein